MIQRTQVIPLFLEVCPEIERYVIKFWPLNRDPRYGVSNLDAYERFDTGDEPYAPEKVMLYAGVDMALTEYLLEKAEAGDTKDFETLFNLAERMLNEGDDEVRNWVAVGLFEGLQNVASNRRADGRGTIHYNFFEPWLGPSSSDDWFALIDFWHGPHEETPNPRKRKSKRRGSPHRQR